MPTKAKTEYLVNKSSGIVHLRRGGLTYESCNVDQIKTLQVALVLDRLYYKRLCIRCFPMQTLNDINTQERAVVARAGAR